MTHSVEWKVTGPAAPMAIEHGVPLYLASDEALIHLLNRYPADLVDIDHDPFEAQRSIPRAQNAASLLRAIGNGEFSLTLRHVEHAAPGLWAEIQHSLGALVPYIGASDAVRMTGQLLLSSSSVRSPYKFDTAGAVLFHLRGVKRVWIYPATETYLPQKAVERAIMKGSEDLPSVRGYDGAAWRFDIVPGEALAWPLFAPNRSEDQEGLCVSLLFGYETRESRITADAHRANGVLRRWGVKIPPMDETPVAMRTILSAMSMAFDRFGLLKPRAQNSGRDFGSSLAADQPGMSPTVAA